MSDNHTPSLELEHQTSGEDREHKNQRIVYNNLVKKDDMEELEIQGIAKKQPLTTRHDAYLANSVFSFDLMATDEEPDEDDPNHQQNVILGVTSCRSTKNKNN